MDIKVAVYDEDKGFDQKDKFVDLIKITVNRLTKEQVLHRGNHRTASVSPIHYQLMKH